MDLFFSHILSTLDGFICSKKWLEWIIMFWLSLWKFRYDWWYIWNWGIWGNFNGSVLTFWPNNSWNNYWATLGTFIFDHWTVLGSLGFHDNVSYYIKFCVLGEIFTLDFVLFFDAYIFHFFVTDLDW